MDKASNGILKKLLKNYNFLLEYLKLKRFCFQQLEIPSYLASNEYAMKEDVSSLLHEIETLYPEVKFDLRFLIKNMKNFRQKVASLLQKIEPLYLAKRKLIVSSIIDEIIGWSVSPVEQTLNDKQYNVRKNDKRSK